MVKEIRSFKLHVNLKYRECRAGCRGVPGFRFVGDHLMRLPAPVAWCCKRASAWLGKVDGVCREMGDHLVSGPLPE